MTWRRALTSWPALWISLVAVVLVALLDVAFRVPDALAAANGYRGGPGMFALDMNLWPLQTSVILAAYGAAGRSAMIVTHVTLDMLLPFAYAVLLFNVLRRAARRAQLNLSPLLLCAPIGAGLADAFENVCFVALALIYPRRSDALTWATAAATWAKFVLLGLAVGCALAMVVLVALRRPGRPPPMWLGPGVMGTVPWLTALVGAGVVLFGVDVDAARPPPPEPACVALLMVGLRGNGDGLGADSGMGGDTGAVVAGVSRRLRGIPAAPVAFPYSTGPPPQIVAHIRSGSRMLAAYLAGRARRCPAERVVLVGQSEGAAIVHLALPAVGRQLTAAVLLGDPARLAGARYDSLGSASNGILAWALLNGPALLGRPLTDVVPAASEPAVRSYCLATDPVCDPSFATELQGIRDDVHTSYRRNAIANQAVEFVVSRVESTLRDLQARPEISVLVSGAARLEARPGELPSRQDLEQLLLEAGPGAGLPSGRPLAQKDLDIGGGSERELGEGGRTAPKR